MPNEVPCSERCAGAVRRSLEKIAPHYSWGSVALGPPEGNEDRWVTLEDLAVPACSERLLARMAKEHEQEDTSLAVQHNYLFRFALEFPLVVAGYLFIAERRVPALAHNVLYQDIEWLQHGRLLEPRLFVLPEDPLAGERGAAVVANEFDLSRVLFQEIDRAFSPLLEVYRARKFVALSNGWGSILDALSQGVLTVGRGTPAMDEIWEQWQEAFKGQHIPSRRRPHLFTCDVDGVRHDYSVRAGCCLYFTTPRAHSSELRYCTTCYLTTDEQRRSILTDHLRRVAAGTHEEAEHGSD